MAVRASTYGRALTTLVESIHTLQEQLEDPYQAHPDSTIQRTAKRH